MQAASTSVSSQGGNVTYDSNASDSGAGYVWLQGTSAGAGAGITTNGGNITLSGGSNPATGYATGDSSTNGNGVTLDTVTLLSGGGNIVVRGQSATSNPSYTTSDGAGGNNDGIRMYGSSVINAGAGTIDLQGVAVGNAAGQSSNAIETSNNGYTQILSSATNTTAITLFGDASGAIGSTNNNWGTFLWGGNTSGLVIAATGAGGGISLDGKGGSTALSAAGVHMEPNTYVLAASGAITLAGTAGPNSQYSAVDINGTVGFVPSLPQGFGIASPVTSSSSNISITADGFSADHVFGSGTFTGSAVQSTGTLTIAPRTTGMALAVQTSAPAAGTLWIDPTNMFGSSGLFKTGFRSFVFGSSTTGTVTLDNYNFDNATTLVTGANAVLGSVVIPNYALTVNVTGNGTVTQTGALNSSGLALDASSSAVTLDNGGDNIGTLAANVASLSLRDAGTLTVGSVGGLNGISASGTLDVETSAGNLTLAQNVATTSTSSAAIVLDAGNATAAGSSTGGDIVLTGSPSVTTGAGGRAVLYTGSVAGSTGVTALIGAGSGNFRYDSTQSTSNFSTALGNSGSFAVYREQPMLLVTPGARSMTYGAALPTFSGTYSGYVNGDTSAGVVGGAATWSVSGARSTSGNPVAGTHDVAYVSGLTSSLGYGFTDNAVSSGELNVGQLALTGAQIAVGSSTYGSPVVAGTVTFGNSISGDKVTATASIDNPVNSASGHLDAGSYTQSVGTILGGADSGNYTFAGYTTPTANYVVNPLALTVSGETAANKVYDATTIASLSGGTLPGVLSGDNVTLVQVGSFDTPNVGNAVTVTAADTITGASAGNYVLSQPTALSANITPAPLMETANTTSMTYGGSLPLLTGSLTGFVNGQTQSSATSGTLTFGTTASSSSPAGSYAITGSGVTPDGNYTIVQAGTNGTALTVNKAPLTITASGQTTTYGTALALGTSAYTDTGLVNRDAISVVTLTQGGNTVVPGTQSAGIYTGLSNGIVASATGTGLSNYTISYVPGTLTIDPKTLTVSGETAQNKVYDGTTTATLTGGTLVGVLSSDAANVNFAQAGTFASQNVGTNMAVTAGDGISGPAAGNYRLTQPTGLAATITQLSSVTWTGGSSGNWFDPANWAGGAVPDLSNVANVTIPSGVTVTFNGNAVVAPAQGGPVSLASLGTAGNLSMVAGTLNVAGNMQLGALTQTGGTITNDGTLTVTTMTQRGGTLGGSGGIQDNGNLTFDLPGNATIGKAISGSGGVTQSGPGTLTMTADNTYSGTTTIDSGTLQVGNGGASGNLGMGAVTDNGNLAIDRSNGATLAQAISGTGGLTQSGPGTTTLTADNTYSGTTTIDAGTLQVGNGGTSGNLGTGAVTDKGNLTVASLAQTGGKIVGSGNLTVTQSFSQTAPGMIAMGGDISITQVIGNLSFSNISGRNIDLVANAGAVTMGTLNATGNLTVNAAGNINQQAGTVIGVDQSSTMDSTGGMVTVVPLGNAFTGTLDWISPVQSRQSSAIGAAVNQSAVVPNAGNLIQPTIFSANVISHSQAVQQSASQSVALPTGVAPVAPLSGIDLTVVEGGVRLPSLPAGAL